MKIIWNENPLRTQVFLDDKEKEEFKEKIKIKDYNEHGSTVWWIPDALTQYSKENYEEYMRELEEGEHDGDCICSPMSCLKCRVESLAGIDTIKGLSKYSAEMIHRAFLKDKNINEAIEELRVPYSKEHERFEKWWLPHIDRWNKEREEAIEWLEAYKKEHSL
ncbi:MAG: hypothetical protein PHW73_04105 [Atribacterota bacterium]|nr:hypothetical protein [Atribacterota bacterium]